MSRRPLFVLLAMLMTCAISALASAAPVHWSGFVKIGGIDQWIGVSGEDGANPILLVVHGGPGEAQWPQAANYRPWEKTFTVVQWDQRGAGRTYGRYKTQTPDVTLQQIALDGVQVAEYLRGTYHKNKIIVLGHSWGTLVAVNMVKQRPELFAAYVGTGQVGSSWARTERFQFDRLLTRARADHDTKTITMLEGVGTLDPTNAKQYFGFAGNYVSVMTPSDQKWLSGLRQATPASLGISQEDYGNLIGGMEFSGQHLWADQSTADLLETAPRLDSACFIIQGRNDFITPTTLAADYLKHVKAPVKELLLIDGGHFAFMTDGPQFLAALVDTVRPVAISRGA
jgi:pimeloyl-ACP methyl ester carboxylesterase